MLTALFEIPPHLGYVALFALIAVETMGIPAPGETALIAAALLASHGDLSIQLVIIIAAGAAILGDNVGFTIGRLAGRKVFLAPGPLHRHRLMLLAKTEPFFQRHGPKAVFLGRWIAALRIASAWLAGINQMRWPTFLFWNMLGGICWAASVGLAAYFAGEAVEKIFKYAGIGAGIAVVVIAAGFFAWRHFKKRREENEPATEQTLSPAAKPSDVN